MINFKRLQKFVEFMKSNFPSEELIFDYKTGKFTSYKTQGIFKVWNLTYAEGPATSGSGYHS